MGKELFAAQPFANMMVVKSLTGRQLRERLYREVERNVALRVEGTA